MLRPRQAPPAAPAAPVESARLPVPSLSADARAAVLAWFDERGRALAFRRTRDPYAILVSEVMAQQTQIARVVDAWSRFLERFPTVESLAESSPADVLRAW
ncbi:MAG: A/G-specific adenine glycosylase, partial [Chloroflexota bacterium]|nr:A/G-specific adenine glycosylase [Chloroflexota bacterium]